MNRAPRLLRRFADAQDGISAIEFSILLPLLLVLFFGGFAVTKTVALSRKMTITARALADLTSQYQSMAQSDMTTVMGASAQILAPFNSTPLGMRISEITTDITGLKTTVTWSSGSNATPYKVGSSFTLPAGMLAVPNMSMIYAETFYVYTPPFGSTILGTINLGDRLYMLPRKSSSIPYSGS